MTASHSSRETFSRIRPWYFRRVVIRQKEGLAHNPRLMLIPDADTQAKWWMRMKDEWVAHRRDSREFRNPIKPTVLRWRS